MVQKRNRVTFLLPGNIKVTFLQFSSRFVILRAQSMRLTFFGGVIMKNFTKYEVKDEGRVELHGKLNLTGAEISVNFLPADAIV